MIWVSSDNGATCRHRSAARRPGIGSDGGDHSFDFYMDASNIAVAYNTHTVPRIGA